MDLGLVGKTVIVTGGASNIGRAITLTFAQGGSNVVIAEIDIPQANKTAEDARAFRAGGRILVIKCDVSRPEEVEAMVRQTIQEFEKIDVLVNNVGWARIGFFIEEPREVAEREVAINFWGVWNCMRAVLPRMIERKYGRIVSISSDAGRMGEFKQATYAGCKAGIIGLSKTVAREVGRYGITVNVVCPGSTVPERPEDIGEMSMWRPDGEVGSIFTSERLPELAKAYPLRKLGKPQDVADAVVFLASERAGHITGQTLSVSGGYTMI